MRKIKLLKENSDSESETSSESTDDGKLPRKRKAEEPFQEFKNEKEYEQYLKKEGEQKIKEEFEEMHIKVGETSGVKTEGETIPIVVNQRRDDLNKQPITQGEIYLNLDNIPFKQVAKIIDDWTQSMSILINNYQTIWTKKRFLDYLAGTFQGEVLHWLKQWESTTLGKA